ncbi:MAG TPA: HlyD family efflux transporter periplasmic adaptor subunit [Planctomycetota bacterium]|nr:HlyD family efflux transporter periplasmic adaptor subunit [Planctomycetota bacterium]
MKALVLTLRIVLGLLIFAALGFGCWLVLLHPEKLQREAKGEEPEPKTDMPVHVAKIERGTLHRYLDCYGVAAPMQLYKQGEASTARIASPAAGIVAEVFCTLGQRVEKGAPLFQLDDRAAKAEELKAEAALASAQATLAKLKASTRPEQITIAEIALNKAHAAYEFAKQNDERMKDMAKDQLAAPKQLEESASQLAAAQQDVLSAEKQLTLLKHTPAPEEIAEAAAKIVEAEKALAATRLQRTLLTIKAPLNATVVRLNVYPGEPVDTTNAVVELVNLDRLEISASVPASELKSLKEGQPVAVFCTVSASEKSASNDEPAFKCTLTTIGQQVDPKTDTATVRVALPAKSGVEPGQSARLRITVEEHRNVLAVPEESVFRDKVGIETIAVIAKDEKSDELVSDLRTVVTLLRENGWIEITGPAGKEPDCKEGDTVATFGSYFLPDRGTKVHILPDEKKRPALEKN